MAKPRRKQDKPKPPSPEEMPAGKPEGAAPEEKTPVERPKPYGLKEIPAEPDDTPTHSGAEPQAEAPSNGQSPEVHVHLPPESKMRPGRTGKRGSPTASTSARQLARRVVGDGSRVEIHKISKYGKEQYVGAYSDSEVNRAASMEDFIQRYLLSGYGEGDYQITVKDHRGKEVANGIKTVLDPHRPATPGVPPQGTEAVGQDLLRSLIDKYENASKQPDMMTQMTQMLGMMKEMGVIGRDNEGKPTGDPTMAMMMMQQMQRQGPDPDIKMMLMQLQQQLAKPPAPPPMPPPPPPKDDGLKATDIMMMMQQMQQQNQQQMQMMLQTLAGSRSSESDLLREQIRELKEERAQGGRDFQDLIQEHDIVDQWLKKRGAGGEPADTPWAFLNNLVNKFPAQVEALTRMRERVEAKKNPPATPDRQLPQGQDAQPQTQQPPTREEQIEALPDEFVEWISKADTAANDSDRIEYVMRSVWSLKDTKFSQVATKMLLHAKNYQISEDDEKRQAEREAVMALIRRLVIDAVKFDMLREEPGEKIVKAFDEHFDDVIQMLKDLGAI